MNPVPEILVLILSNYTLEQLIAFRCGCPQFNNFVLHHQSAIIREVLENIAYRTAASLYHGLGLPNPLKSENLDDIARRCSIAREVASLLKRYLRIPPQMLQHTSSPAAWERAGNGSVSAIAWQGNNQLLAGENLSGRQSAALYPFSFEEFDSSRGFPVDPKIARNATGAYWASTANPCQWLCSFAVAASNGSAILLENEGGWISEGSQSIHGRREVVAVDWLGPSVVLKGCSNCKGSQRCLPLRCCAPPIF